LRHCQECGHPWPQQHDICPDCWEPTQDDAPEPAGRLRLVYQTHTPYEAEMILVMLRNEGIPSMKVPENGAELWPMATASPLTLTRVFVHAGNLALAKSLVEEVTRGETRAP
jgi:hypothetical protein